MPVHADSLHRLAVAERPIPIPPPAENVKALQGESRRVDLGVASGTFLEPAVFFQLLADRDCAPRIGFDGGNVRGWRRWWLAEKPLHHPHAPQDRGSRRAIGGDLENARLRQQAAAVTLRG